MKNLLYKYFLRLLIGVVVSFPLRSDVLAWNNTALEARNFAPGKLEEHYLKHGYQFGNITKEQYLQEAQVLLDTSAGADVLEKIRPNGDVEHYRVSDGEFAVMTKRGRIRTFYKTNYRYWIRH